ncbi:MAG: bifunctional riboflavin kinase/FAD synthetase [Anaerolineae bacterium]|jgi:riboflavin kinase/FMN adenylyltransferase|nr:bifunctional riboflavin kinase/FAD synthetase [Anaerolineae bacterium]MBT3713290.1 bifunctional riboflavin kinase/FAD synthetase [Anaerolineae bacterium]MBT4312048.1 bifunctional riboflavin kinase/FAD synthetase [Anaerolineae bacterium]MBT4459504.1 bifunctional riboflavin kinase/FAD synthetase [Anaerolineae bacterium]MBT4842112.1 bifunctional riboflavin kinase/FAD synthetase [Anaerolineae bacterium]
MLHLHSLEDLSLQKTWLTIGIFDGVHCGHQEIIRHLTAGAKRANAAALVISFYPHPAAVLGKRKNVKYLSLPDEKAELLEKLGVDVFLEHPFDQEIATLSAKEFMVRIEKRVQLKKMLIGYDFALGKDRQGDAEYLTALGEKSGYAVQTFEPLLSEGAAISSSRVRDALADGHVRDAHHLLGHPYTLCGSVIHGDGRGRKINIPTANIEIKAEKITPKNGVYATWAILQGKKHPAVTNIGIRPTFTPDKERANIETHILGFSKNIYGEELKLELVERLRDEKKFSSVNELLQQIHADIEKAQEILK